MGFPKPQHQTEGWTPLKDKNVKAYIINPETIDMLNISNDIGEYAKSILLNQETYKVGAIKGVPIYASKLIPKGGITIINKGS